MPTGTLLLTNGPLTFGGRTNSHAIVSFSYVAPGSSLAADSGPVLIVPGAFLPLTLPSGSYNLAVVYEDGRSERLQTPPDQVDVYASEVRRVLFMPD
jgi:hypothetical protein